MRNNCWRVRFRRGEEEKIRKRAKEERGKESDMRMKARDKGSDGRTKREIEIETNDLRGKDLRKR